MRRDILVSDLEKIIDDLDESGARQMLDKFVEKIHVNDADRNLWLDFSVFQTLSVQYSKYTENQKEIIDNLKFSEIYSASFWESVHKDNAKDQVYVIRNTVIFFSRYVPYFIHLLKFDPIGKGLSGDISNDIVQIILPEPEGSLTNPSRVINSINAVVDLYDIISELGGGPSSKISVANLDSGSDKSITFIGAGDVAKSIRGLITDIWDRILLGGANKSRAEIKNISESLQVFGEISKQEKSGALSRERAEILRRKLVDCTAGIVDTGAIISDMEQRTLPSARAIVQERQLLLSAPAPRDGDSKEQPAGSDSVDEVVALRAELAALRASKKKTLRRPKKLS